MSQLFITCLLWFAAIGCGLLAGLYFAFSTFIMSALGRIEQTQGISAMKSINTTILQSLFMPFFWGTTVASVILFVVGLVRRGEPGAMATFAGGLIYVGGMFICTVLFNVPLNNALAAVTLRALAVWLTATIGTGIYLLSRAATVTLRPFQGAPYER